MIDHTAPPSKTPLAIHLLDVGTQDYGDSLLIEARGRRILIDGGHRADFRGSVGHPSIPDQLRALTGEQRPQVDLMVATHTHLDHVGCLPELVSNHTLDVEWALLADPDLGWGQSVGSADPITDDARIAAAVSGLREEPPTRPDQLDLPAFLSDAADLRTRYVDMIAALTAAGTHVVKHGIDDPASLLATFAPIKLEILGPSRTQLALCARGIKSALADAIVTADRLLSGDSLLDAAALYDALRSGPVSDASPSRPGPLINNQSTILSIAVSGRRAFFGGDMQLARPETGDPDLRAEITALRGAIRSRGPFSFAKLGHHGSENAQDATVLDDWGRPSLLGITLGSGSSNHPTSTVLGLLADQPDTTWARTDHNGLSTFARSATKWRVTPTRGVLNDQTLNRTDVVAGPIATPSIAPTTSQPAGNVASTERPGGNVVEVTIRVPDDVDHVRVDIDLVRRPGATGRPLAEILTAGSKDSDTPVVVPDLRVGGGRTLPSLLYVTESARLAHNVGVAEASHCLEALEEQPGAVLDLAGLTPGDVAGAEAAVQAKLGADPALAGVVLVGGYDVVPSHRFDTLPASFEGIVRRGEDLDHFYVWTDDFYGRLAGMVTRCPVSRVPDGRSAATLFGGLGATAGSASTSRGVRNVKRPYADDVYAALPSAAPIDISEPVDSVGVGTLVAEYTYFMLHGSDQDASRLWGEGPAGPVEAVNLRNITTSGPSPKVVLAGACWGALATDATARFWQSGLPLPPRLASNSVAVRLLARGAVAFVGCTGSHYSPGPGAPNTMGRPIHVSFWSGILAGLSPAEALLRAKLDFLTAMPHGLSKPVLQAYENKMFWQFTCLGLGW